MFGNSVKLCGSLGKAFQQLVEAREMQLALNHAQSAAYFPSSSFHIDLHICLRIFDLFSDPTGLQSAFFQSALIQSLT
jgi:hypothetical protein